MMTPTAATPIVDRLRPQVLNAGLTWDAFAVLGGALLVALTAQVAIPMPSGVPITGQTFGVLLVGAALGARRGAAALGAYLGFGFFGLPVFALGAVPGVTLGYLAAFVPAAWLVGLLAQRGWDRSALRTVMAMTLGTAVIFGGGLSWGAIWIGLLGEALPVGFGSLPHYLLWGMLLPYLPGAAIKIALAVALLPAAWKVLGRQD